MSLTTTKPSDIPFKSGWRRLLLYFTDPHTRSTYKNTDYNNAATCFILNKLLANEEGGLLDGKYLNSLKLDSNLLKRCTWCNLHWKEFSNSIDKNLSGNRRHIFLFCNNIDIKNFRDFIRDDIERSLVFFTNLLETFQVSWEQTIGCTAYKTFCYPHRKKISAESTMKELNPQQES